MLVSSHGPRRVGRYLLCDQIGSGGMATIVLARMFGPEGFSRTVAVKRLHPQFAHNPQFVAMLLDEARLAVRVRHVNVVSPLDIVVKDSELFIVMDYVSGESLANLLVAAAAPLEPSLAAAIFVQVLLGLHAAHEATREQGESLGLVHRDVSPQNILVGQDGVSRVLDFGIAKAVARTQTTDGGMIKGKLGYMAPEQLVLEPADRRTDVFSAGVVLWEALTGTGLFVADTLGASIELITRGEIAPPSRHNPAVTPELDAVVLKALERERGARYQDALAMAAALERATPLASTLEVIDWVQKLAGPELVRREALVRRAEALTAEAVVTSPGALVSEVGAARGSVSPLAVTSASLAGPSRPSAVTEPARRRLGPVVAATRESTGVAVGSDREPGGVLEARSGRERRALALALGILVAGSAAALGIASVSWVERQRSSSVAEQPLEAEPASEAAGAPEAPSAATGAPPFVQPASLPPAPVRQLSLGAPPREPPSIERSPARRSRGGAARGSGSARSARSGGVASRRRAASTASSGAEPPASPARSESGASAPRPARDACTPPWVMGEQNIKIFKAECVR